jgi:hypothetical protein
MPRDFNFKRLWFPLVPAQAGTQGNKNWIPAFAGMSGQTRLVSKREYL